MAARTFGRTRRHAPGYFIDPEIAATSADQRSGIGKAAGNYAAKRGDDLSVVDHRLERADGGLGLLELGEGDIHVLLRNQPRVALLDLAQAIVSNAGNLQVGLR